MVPERRRPRAVALVLLRLAIFALVIYGALELFLFRNVIEKPLAFAGQDATGRTRMETKFSGKVRTLSLWGVTLFELSKTVTPVSRSTICANNGKQFLPWRATRATFQILTNRVELLFPTPQLDSARTWMIRSRANIRYKIKVGPARFQIVRPVRFVSAIVSNTPAAVDNRHLANQPPGAIPHKDQSD